MKSLLFFTALIIFLAFVTISCDSQAEQRSEVNNIGSQPNFGGTLVVGIAGDVDTFNPLYTRSSIGLELMHLTLLGLADLNDQGEFVPELAESWEHSADFLKLTYKLRRNARWSDGMPISAHDVKFTFDRLMDPEAGSPRYAYTEFIKNVVVEDSFSVSFEFTEAYPAQMFDTAGEVLPKHILENVDITELQTHQFGQNPIASGPFILKKWENNQYLEFAANEHYFSGRPYLDKVIFKIVPDNNNLFTQLQTGEIDMLLDVTPEKVSQLSSNENLQIFNVPGRVYNYIGYNQSNPLFKSKNIRRALTMAIDRDKIIGALLYGFGKSCISPFLPMISWAYNNEIEEIPFNPVQARAMFNSEGWQDTDNDGWLDKNGKTFEFSIKTNADNSLRSDIAVIVQNQLKQVGVKTNIELLEWTTMLEDMQQRKFEAYISGLSSSLYINPTPIYHSTAVELFNYVSYSNPDVDRLIEAGRIEMNQQRAAEIWREVQDKIYADQPYTYLFWINRVVAVNKQFQNVTPVTLSSLYNLEKWYLNFKLPS